MQKSLKIKLISAVSLGLTLAMLTALLGIWLSGAKYTTQMSGKAEYEPALFNTVLLGDLKFKHEVKSADGQTTTTVTETNGKLGASIIVDDSMAFGAVPNAEGGNSAGDMTSDERRLRPGSVVAIPFTVTNGTTLPTAEGESNLAETDILYSMKLITTVNLPLEYDIYEYTTEAQLANFKAKSKDDNFNYENYQKVVDGLPDGAADENWGTKLGSEKGAVEPSPLIGQSRTHEIRPTTYKAEGGTEETNKFPLVRGNGNEITVDRYMLVIYWPDDDEDNKSTKYMKEIDILEIRLEVESWVQNGTVSTPTYTEGSKGIMTIAATAVGDETYYFLPESGTGPTVDNVFSRYTVPFYATRKETVDSVTYDYLDFTVTNQSGKVTHSWDAEKQEYTATVEAQSALKDGRVAIAVPVRAVMGTVNDYASAESKFSYSIEYNGKTYIGTLTDSYITTDVHGKNNGDDKATDPYKTTKQHAYRIVEFSVTEGDVKTPLTLNEFTSDKISEENLRLVIKNSDGAVNYDNKDNFKILVYKPAAESGEGSGSGDQAEGGETE